MFTNALLVLALASSSLTSPAANARPHGMTADSTSAASNARRHTTLGVAIAPVPDAFRALDYLVPGEGVVIAQIQSGSAADAAQLRVGDMVLAIDGKRVDETTLFYTVRQIPRGRSFTVELLRDKRWMQATVVIDP